jgi:hypothetical protein
MGRGEKAVWVLLVTLLTVFELRTITWSDQDSEKDREYAQCVEHRQFQGVLDAENADFVATAAALEKSYEQSHQQFNTTIGGISKEIGTYTGGHSYLVLYYVPGQGFLMFSQKGEYSVFDAQARIADLDTPMTPQNIMGTTVNIGEVPKGLSASLSVPRELIEKRAGVSLNVFFVARNGQWTEQLRTRRIKDGWTYAIRVQGIFSDLKKSRIVCESVAKDFPMEALDKDFKALPLNPKLPPCFP